MDRPSPFPSGNGTFSQFRRQASGFLVRYGEYDSAETLAFLELIEKLLVSASGTALFPSRVSGWELARTIPISFVQVDRESPPQRQAVN